MAIGKASLQRASELNAKDSINAGPITDKVIVNETVPQTSNKKVTTKKATTKKKSNNTTSTSSSKNKVSSPKKDAKINSNKNDERQISNIHSDLPVHLL